ncbi:MAG TPA: hypothetical protein VGS07_12155 [Thermoanaerobaculia bacterium]|nr:hypothetical protein [Thermoanaerobaculia bacterium]
MKEKFDRPRANLWQVDLDLAFLADQAHFAVTGFAEQGTVDFDRLVDALGTGTARLLAVALAGLTPRRLGIALRFPFRERCRLALATPPQLLDDLLQLLDSAILLQQPAPQLSVLLKKFLVSLHQLRILGQASELEASPSQHPRAPS